MAPSDCVNLIQYSRGPTLPVNPSIQGIAFNNAVPFSYLANRSSRNISAKISALHFKVGLRGKQDHGTEHCNALVFDIHEVVPLENEEWSFTGITPTRMKTGSSSIISQHQPTAMPNWLHISIQTAKRLEKNVAEGEFERITSRN